MPFVLTSRVWAADSTGVSACRTVTGVRVASLCFDRRSEFFESALAMWPMVSAYGACYAILLRKETLILSTRERYFAANKTSHSSQSRRQSAIPAAWLSENRALRPGSRKRCSCRLPRPLHSQKYELHLPETLRMV